MKTNFIPLGDLRLGSHVVQWAAEYLTQENPALSRPNQNSVICPFMKRSMESNSFYLTFHPEVTGEIEGQIEEIIEKYITPFMEFGPSGSGSRQKKSLAIIFPNLPTEKCGMLDDAHLNLKSTFVSSGLMIAQFHPTCDVRSVHNEELRVAISPIPLMAVRHMSTHDSLFLEDREDWMKEYFARFPEKKKRVLASVD